MNTPWGKADYQERLDEGIYSVGTPSHGGIYVTEKAANSRLTELAREHATFKRDGRYWYEEDCDWAIVAYEIPALFANVSHESIVSSLQNYNLEYYEAF